MLDSTATTEPPRQLATVRDYAQLHTALRLRADELKTTREAIDDLAGLQNGYAAKLLAPVPIKSLGRESLGPMLAVLGFLAGRRSRIGTANSLRV
jgi:hypothetical protein